MHLTLLTEIKSSKSVSNVLPSISSSEKLKIFPTLINNTMNYVEGRRLGNLTCVRGVACLVARLHVIVVSPGVGGGDVGKRREREGGGGGARSCLACE